MRQKRIVASFIIPYLQVTRSEQLSQQLQKEVTNLKQKSRNEVRTQLLQWFNQRLLVWTSKLFFLSSFSSNFWWKHLTSLSEILSQRKYKYSTLASVTSLWCFGASGGFSTLHFSSASPLSVKSFIDCIATNRWVWFGNYSLHSSITVKFAQILEIA